MFLKSYEMCFWGGGDGQEGTWGGGCEKCLFL